MHCFLLFNQWNDTVWFKASTRLSFKTFVDICHYIALSQLTYHMSLHFVHSRIKLVCLTPQFRLLRMLECRIRGGDLHDIDALLGCPIISPAPEVFDNFDNLVVSEQHMALSCLFYTVNWFRELLNAFVTQKEREMKDRVSLGVRDSFLRFYDFLCLEMILNVINAT